MQRVVFIPGLLVLGVLSGCASVTIPSEKPSKPETVAEARTYLENRPRMIRQMNYELNVQERACYDRFMVSDCVDEVRACTADYRRAHIEAEAAANDLIRLDRLKKRNQ